MYYANVNTNSIIDLYIIFYFNVRKNNNLIYKLRAKKVLMHVPLDLSFQ